MSSMTSTTYFFANGTSAQFEYMLGLYPEVLKLKADNRGAGKKPEKLIRLDDWYQNKLPLLIKKRGKDAFLEHEELVQTMEWKQTRGKFYPQLTHLIKINTPRAVMMETKKAFRKLPNLEQALNALNNLKGVGITMASALLAAASPETAPFMADECLNAIPEFDTIDYTAKEYLRFVTHIQTTMDRLNKEHHGAEGEKAAESEENGAEDKPKKWTAHSVELAVWAHSIANELQPELLKGMPDSNGVVPTTNGTSSLVAAADYDDSSQNGGHSDESNLDSESASKDGTVMTNGALNTDSLDGSESGTNPGSDAIGGESTTGKSFPADSLDECSKSGDSLDDEPPVQTTAAADGDAAEAAADSDSQSNSSLKRPLFCEDSEDQSEMSAPKVIKL